MCSSLIAHAQFNDEMKTIFCTGTLFGLYVNVDGSSYFRVNVVSNDLHVSRDRLVHNLVHICVSLFRNGFDAKKRRR